MNIKDVAKNCGVSIATVSRVLNGTSYVSPKLVERVLNSVEKLGYKPSKIAQSLRKGETYNIGFLVPDISNLFFSSIIKGANDVLENEGYIIFLCNSYGDRKKEVKLLEKLFISGIDGLIVVPIDIHNNFIDFMTYKKIKVLVIDEIINKKNISSIASDNYNGMIELIDYLYVNGHSSFVFLSGNPSTFSARKRTKAFEDKMRDLKINDFKIILGEYTYESGIKMAKKIEKIPDAIVCGNDMIAFGVINQLKRDGFRIPEDVSVTGFDDVIFSSMVRPSLTTVKQDPYEMGRAGGQLMLKMLKGKEKNEIRLLKTQLKIRESTCGRK